MEHHQTVYYWTKTPQLLDDALEDSNPYFPQKQEYVKLYLVGKMLVLFLIILTPLFSEKGF